MNKSVLYGLLVFLFSSTVAFAQTGKITGQVTDAETGQPLPGVNVVLAGTEMGAATSGDGYYTILNVPPGSYTLQASFIGYATTTVQNVRVNIDLTSTHNLELQTEAIAGQEVVVEAVTPIVQPDVSANIANVSAVEIENIPVAGVSEFINLQAGIEPGMTIRGSGLSEMSFVIDGMTTRDAHTDQPFTGVSYTSVDEFQVQTGGFNAEYGQVRSGLINVVTKEGDRNNYSFDILTRYSPPQKEYFGISPDDPMSFYNRPYMDPDVAYIGTDDTNPDDGDGVSPWDRYTQDQNQQFDGWNDKVQDYNDETHNMTPEEALALYEWRTRKDVSPSVPRFDFDASLSGPVPFIGRPLGGLRFIGSYRSVQKPYIVPQSRDRMAEQLGQLKVTSNITQNMKLMLSGMVSEQTGLGHGYQSMYSGDTPAYPWDNRWNGHLMANDIITGGNEPDEMINAYYMDNPIDINRSMFGAKLTHTLSQNTVYEVKLQRNFTKSLNRPGRPRDFTPVKYFGTYAADEAPQGWTEIGFFDPINDDLRLSGHWGHDRDSSEVALWNGSFDLTSQIAHFSQLKAGVEFYLESHDAHYGQWDNYFSNEAPKYIWNRDIFQGAAYLQNKLEFQGLIANIGLRMDYFNPLQEYYVYDKWTRGFSSLIGYFRMDEYLDTEAIEPQIFLSPRLGVSYPITANSKLFFNYGHFRQVLNAEDLVGRRYIYTGQIDEIGNPQHPMPRTVSYELGYEHNIANQFLLRMTGYYKSKDQQPSTVTFVSIDELVNYDKQYPRDYQDVRGFEISLNKNRGQYIQGFINYTYLVTKSGQFGYNHLYENDYEQFQHELWYNQHYVSNPIPEPFARFNVTFLAPQDFGPQFAGISPLGDWRLSLLGEYRAGDVFTWHGGVAQQGLADNVRWRDFYMLDIRLAKNFETDFGRAQLFIDVNNIFNLKYLYRYSAFDDSDNFDWDNYMKSLRLSDDTFEELESPPYSYIPGDDSPGDYRPTGVDFQPVEIVSGLPDSPETGRERGWYYNQENEEYYRWENDSWAEVPGGEVNEMVDNKAYIDNPNDTSFSFLNPRQVLFGVRFWF